MTDPRPAGPNGDAAIGLSEALLREVARLLARLADQPDCSDAIDLHSLPLDKPERDRLRSRLGIGEVQAALDVAGPTHITETAYAGVWWVRHGDDHGDALLEQIVVARVPELLLAHPSSIGEASARLTNELSAAPGSRPGFVKTAEMAHD